MADAIQVSSLPLPPMQYVNQYTDEIIRRGRAPKPPPPIQDTYHMFGNAFNPEESIIRPLESQVNYFLLGAIRCFYVRYNVHYSWQS